MLGEDVLFKLVARGWAGINCEGERLLAEGTALQRPPGRKDRDAPEEKKEFCLGGFLQPLPVKDRKVLTSHSLRSPGFGFPPKPSSS